MRGAKGEGGSSCDRPFARRPDDKDHEVVEALGDPMRIILTPGQASDITQGETLIQGLSAEHVLGNKGYDAKSLRDAITEQGAITVIPPRPTSPRSIVTSRSSVSPIWSRASS
jgi:transposase